MVSALDGEERRVHAAGEEGQSDTRNRVLIVTLSGVAIVAICLVFLGYTRADPDLWGHVLFGRDIAVTRTLALRDSYSFTSDSPWINHEWLSEVIMFLAWSGGGSAGLFALKLLLILGSGFLAFRRIEQTGYPPAVRYLLLWVLAAGLAPIAATVRPQLFSLFLFTILLALLMAADRGRHGLLVWIPPLLALWSNLHGGWLVGLLAVSVWLAFAGLDSNRRGLPQWYLLAVGVATLVATLANPYGFGMWRFLIDTVGFGRPDIIEWQSIGRALGYQAVAWGATAAVAAGLVATNGRANKWRYVALALVLAVASFRVSRLLAFFAVATVCLVQTSSSLPAVRPLLRAGSQRPAAFGVVTWILALVILAPVGAQLTRDAACIEMPGSSSRFPDATATQFLVANGVSGQMVTWFDWGEYAIWYLKPGIRVSMDGRRETVYSSKLLAEHWDFYYGGRIGANIAALANADFAWLPVTLPAVGRLEREGWIKIFEGPISVVLSRTPIRVVYPASSQVGGRRCFPGP